MHTPAYCTQYAIRCADTVHRYRATSTTILAIGLVFAAVLTAGHLARLYWRDGYELTAILLGAASLALVLASPYLVAWIVGPA